MDSKEHCDTKSALSSDMRGLNWRTPMFEDSGAPPRVKAELARELLAAKRALFEAMADQAGHLIADARERVDEARVALGQRGSRDRESQSTSTRRRRVEAVVCCVLRARASADDASICPSEAAKVVYGAAWREYLDDVKSIAFKLAEQSRVEIVQNDEPVIGMLKGPYRLRLKRDRFRNTR